MYAFEVEGLGHHANGQNAGFACRSGDDRCRPGPGAAAHAGGDESHMRAFEIGQNLVERLFSRGAADIRPGPGAKPLGDAATQLNAAFAKRLLQGLGIGVGHKKLDPTQLGLDHVVDGIAAGATDTDDGDLRRKFWIG